MTNFFEAEKYRIFFIFRENSIILKDGFLPGAELFKKCISHNVASDWFCEEEWNYACLLLEPSCPNPAGCTDIPIREFFFRMETEENVSENIRDLPVEQKMLSPLAARARGLLSFRVNKRYCAKCGSALKNDENFTARTCVQCGTQYFPQIEPAVIILVHKGDEILLAKHKNRNDDVYSCIAGFVEIGETIEQTVRRELKEETGISVKNIKYAGSQGWPYPDQLMLAFTAEYESGEIKVQEEELLEAKWFKKDALPKVPKPGSVAYKLISGIFS